MANDVFDFEAFIKKEGIVVKDKLTVKEKEDIAKSIIERDLKGNKNPSKGLLENVKFAVESAIKRAEDELLAVVPIAPAKATRGSKSPKAAKVTLDEIKKADYIKLAVEITDAKERDKWVDNNVLKDYRRAVKRNATIQLAKK